MSDLLPQNATAAERALSEAIARVSSVPVVVRQVWNPDACPAEILPWLAWAFSVDEWDPAWTDAQKREVIRQSVKIHSKKGTVEAVKTAVNAIFGTSTVLEWYEFDGEPHTFKIQTRGRLPNEDAFRRLIRLVTAAKPLRSHLISVQILRDADLSLVFGMGAHLGSETGVLPRVAPTIEALSLRLGVAYHSARETGVANRITFEGAGIGYTPGMAQHYSKATTVAAAME